MTAALHGWLVGVTADRRAAEQCRLLERQGARVLHAPMLRVVPHGGDDELAATLDALIEHPPQVVVLTTGVGARTWFDAADAAGRGEALRHALAGAEVLVRGPKAAAAAFTEGLAASWQAPGATSAELVARLVTMGVAGQRVAVQLDGRTDPVLGDAVRALGAEVVDVALYRWTAPEDGAAAQRLIEAVAGRRVDAVTFTSAPALSSLLELADAQGLAGPVGRHLGADVAVVSVGPVCSAAARDAGIEPTVEPERHRLGPMISALAAWGEAADADAAVTVTGRRIVLRATAVVIDDEVVELPGREWGVLATLLERAGGVVGRDALLRLSGFDADATGHTVEVAVGRLRRRLDGLLDVVAVPRRGYRLAVPAITRDRSPHTPGGRA